MNAIWDSFLSEWPVDRVRSMTLDEYTNLNRSDAFVYWLEKTTEKLGSIWGGSAFKWGTCQRNPDSDKSGSPSWGADHTHSLHKRGGCFDLQVTLSIHERLQDVIEAVQPGAPARVGGARKRRSEPDRCPAGLAPCGRRKRVTGTTATMDSWRGDHADG